MDQVCVVSELGPTSDFETRPAIATAADGQITCSFCGNVIEGVVITREDTQEVVIQACGLDLAKMLEALTGYRYVNYYQTLDQQHKLRRKKFRQERIVEDESTKTGLQSSAIVHRRGRPGGDNVRGRPK